MDLFDLVYRMEMLTDELYGCIIVWIFRLGLRDNKLVALKRAHWFRVRVDTAYLELVYLVTALVPSETACLASSPGRRSLTAVWISREVMVDLLL